MRVSLYSPLPPERSGIADYSALLLPPLRRRMDVVVARRGKRPPDADVALYHVGNNHVFHDWIVEALDRRPGVVVLHEVVLHHMVAGMTLGRGDAAGYLDALERAAGLPGKLLGLGVVNQAVPPLWETDPERFPLVEGVLAGATRLVVHSRYVERGARAAGFTGPIRRVTLAAAPPPDVVPEHLGGGPVIGSFGHVNTPKRIPQLIAAFAELLRPYPEARLLLVGPTAPGFDVGYHLGLHGLRRSPAVVREEWVPEERFWSLMAGCDVCVNLRAPTMGETSASAVQSLALGLPLVVSDLGWFAELPDDVVLKVPVDRYEVPTLAAALELLAGDDAVRAALGERSREYARSEHDVERVAEAYAEELELAAGGEAVVDVVLGEVARAAADVGIGADSDQLGEIAARIRELRLVP